VVIVGASFIGMEVAAYLSDKASSVTVVGKSDIPFRLAFGPKIGLYLQKLHLNKNVKFVMETGPKEFITNGEGILEKVVLENGEELDADVVVLGLGVNPSTDYIIDEEVEKDSRGYIIVNECMKTNVDNIFAVGDIAKFPLDLPTFEGVKNINVGHWQIANAHGKCAALNIATVNPHSLKTVPFFWTMQYGKSIRYAGCAPDGYDDIVYDGDVEEGKFVAFYLKNDIVMAVATLGRDPVAADFANLMLEGKTLSRENITNEVWRNKYSLSAKI
jgi:NADPH-dependent 2,4-dienoyl-CoA reductase/sulfur reductase-like enzyme